MSQFKYIGSENMGATYELSSEDGLFWACPVDGLGEDRHQLAASFSAETMDELVKLMKGDVAGDFE